MVIAGKDRGKTGVIARTIAATSQVVIEGINVTIKHQKNKQTRSQGQIIEKSMPFHASNVALVEGKKAVRVGYRFEGEGKDRKKVRVARPSGKKI